MKKAFTILLAFFILTQGSAMADRAGHGRIDRGTMAGYGNGYKCSSLTANAKLKLTEEQATRILSLDEKYTHEIELIREQLFVKGRELKSEWLQTEPDRARIEALQEEVSKLRKRLRATLAAHREEVLNVLTLEQRALVPDSGFACLFYKPAGFGRR
jgi:Spy/CpxP family protein refolding chaperone